MSAEIQYPDTLIGRLHTIWGEGFLSPGGPEEVSEIVAGLDLTGKTILDIGFGTGGPIIVLARDHDAAQIVGIDVEAPMKDRADAIVARAGLSDKVTLKIIEPGSLPFEDESFDVVFSKDAIIHVADKPALFGEILRVLKPGGVFVASDWLSGETEEQKRALDGFRTIAHLEFNMATAPEMEAVLSDAGFDQVSTRDRNAWFAINVDREIEAIEGPLRAPMVETFGEEKVARWIEVTHERAKAVHGGGLRPTHLRGFKPAQ